MVAPSVTVCTRWASSNEVVACGACASLDDVSPALINRWLDFASDYLFRRSGRQWPGSCSVTVRPCGGVNGGTGVQHLADTDTYLVPQSYGDRDCYRDSVCECGGVPQVWLGYYPITDINQVRIDGVILAPTAYEVQDDRWLVRIDGQTWPCCQDLTRDAASESNTWSVSFDYGTPPPPTGKEAAIELACWLTLACTPGDCQLPPGVTSVARNGLTMNFASLENSLDHDLTGLPLVDMFLQGANPQGLQRAATVLSPDIGKPERRTTDVSTS